MTEKPISPRRAAEFRGRRLRMLFGTRKERAERFAKLVRLYGYDIAVAVSARSERYALRMNVRTHKGLLDDTYTHKPCPTYDRGNP